MRCVTLCFIDLRVMLFAFDLSSLACLSYHAESTLWFPTLKYRTFSVVHDFFEMFDGEMVMVPSRLRLPLLSPCISRTEIRSVTF